MKNQILLSSDPCYIVERLKEIDENYFVVFNSKRQCFEVHSHLNAPSTFALTIPFDTLDERAVFLTLRTRKQNMQKLIEEMDRENERRKQNLVKMAAMQIKEVTT